MRWGGLALQVGAKEEVVGKPEPGQESEAGEEEEAGDMELGLGAHLILGRIHHGMQDGMEEECSEVEECE